MKNFLVWWLANAVSLFVVTLVLPGVHVAEGVVALAFVAFVIGAVNALLSPLLRFLACGFIVMTMGLIIPVLNALLLVFADWLIGDAFEIDGFGWAILAALIMSVVNWALSGLLGDDKKKDKRKS